MEIFFKIRQLPYVENGEMDYFYIEKKDLFMNLQTTMILLLFAILIIVMVWFGFQKKQLERKHLNHISSLEKAISLHREQIAIRKDAIRRYDFLKYNLDETLIVQREIILGI